MLSIQTAGSQILNDNPGKFYIFIGSEYGVKYKYIEHLHKYYGEYVEFDSAADVLMLMGRRHFPPLKPKLYIIRYDEAFLSSGITAKDIAQSKIIGTVVLIYEAEKLAKLCIKNFPDYTVPFDTISKDYIKRYLKQDYPTLPDTVVESVTNLTIDYMSAYNTCRLISAIPDPKEIVALTDARIQSCFGTVKADIDKKLRYAFAAKNYSSCIHILDNYQGDIASIYYVLLSTLLDLERGLSSKQKTDVAQYLKNWNPASVYNMFAHVYDELSKSRKSASYNIFDRLMYLFAVSQYAEIPKIGVV